MSHRFLLIAAVVLLAGCAGRSSAPPSGQPQRMIRVDWYGYQCFRIQSALGISVLTNPFAAGSTSFTPPKNLAPDILLVTNEESDVNNIDLVTNSPNIFRGSVGTGRITSNGIHFLGVPVFANPETREVSGMNVVYR